MVRLSDVTKEYRAAGPLNSLLGICCSVDEHTFLTKSGQLMQVISLKGVDHECLDHPQLDHVCRRFEAAMRTLTGAFRIYQVILKRDHAALPHGEYANAAVRQAVRNRVDYLARKSTGLYTVELFMVIVYEANLGTRGTTESIRNIVREPRLSLTQWLSHERNLHVLETDLEQALSTLAHKVDSFIVQLRDVVELELLDTQGGFRMFSRFLNYAPCKSDHMRLNSNEGIDYQLASSALECHRDHLAVDGYQVRVLTLKEPPAQTFPNLFA